MITFSYLKSSMLNLDPILTPKAWQRSLISLFVFILEDAAPKTLRILPRNGSNA